MKVVIGWRNQEPSFLNRLGIFIHLLLKMKRSLLYSFWADPCNISIKTIKLLVKMIFLQCLRNIEIIVMRMESKCVKILFIRS